MCVVVAGDTPWLELAPQPTNLVEGYPLDQVALGVRLEARERGVAQLLVRLKVERPDSGKQLVRRLQHLALHICRQREYGLRWIPERWKGC